jgi:hypothetical protein
MGEADRSGERGICHVPGEPSSHGLMCADPEADPPSLMDVLWLTALVLAAVLYLASYRSR